MAKSPASTEAIVMERTFNAPMNLIWQMWTEPEHFRKWYGPNGFSVPVAEFDLRIGGKRLVCMASPDGRMKMWSTGEHVEVTPIQRLVYTESMADENGNVMPPSAMGMPEGFPTTTQVSVILEDLGGRTKMVLTHAGMPADSPGAGGWNQAFEKLAAYVEKLSTEK